MNEKEKILKEKMLDYITLLKQCNEKVKEIEELDIIRICHIKDIQITRVDVNNKKLILDLAYLFNQTPFVFKRESTEFPYGISIQVNDVTIFAMCTEEENLESIHKAEGTIKTKAEVNLCMLKRAGQKRRGHE